MTSTEGRSIRTRVLRVGGGLAVAAVVTLTVLVALDRLMDWFDLGYRTRRNAPSARVRLERSEFTFEVVTNALGFRDARLPSPKPPGTVRVVVLGDSFTQGFGVAEDEAYPRRLERELTAGDPAHHYEVINLGVPGTNPRDYEGNLTAVGLSYAPDVVLVAVGANDAHDVRIQPRIGTQFGWERLPEARREAERAPSVASRVVHFLFPSLYPFVRERLVDLVKQPGLQSAPVPESQADSAVPSGRQPGRWKDVLLALAASYGRRTEVAARLPGLDLQRVARIEPLLSGELPLGTEAGEEAYWNVIALIEPTLLSDAVLLPPAYDDAWSRVARRLRGIARAARHEAARPMLTFIPDEHQVSAEARAIVEARGFRWDARTLSDTTFTDRLRALSKSEGMEFVDLLTTFRAHSAEALYFPRDGHWTPAGHELAARVLAAGVLRSDGKSQPW